MKIAIYSRKSKFTGKGDSVENQITTCKEYIEKHFGESSIMVYEDEGFSGGDTDRPQFQKLIKDAESKKFDVLICYRLDRISRNISDFAGTIEMLEENNIAFVSVKEQFDTSTPMGRAMLYIASVFAQLERETIAERIKDNMYQLARTGRWLGGNLPTGFGSEPVVFIDENYKERKLYSLSPIDEELEIVKEVFEKYMELGSMSKVEAYSYQQDFKTKNGKFFGKNAVKSILTNPVYAKADKYSYEYFSSLGAQIANPANEWNGTHGIMAYNKQQIKKGKYPRLKDTSEWIIAIGRHEGIIPGKEWIQVQSQIGKNRDKAPRRGTSYAAMLSGILRCNFCDSYMQIKYDRVVKSTGKRRFYYMCNTKEVSKGSKCQCPNLPGEKTDQDVIDTLKYMIDNGLLEMLDKQQKKLGNKKNQSKDIYKQIEKNQKAIENLVKQLSENESSTVTKYIIAEMEKLEKDNTELQRKLEIDTTPSEILNIEILKAALIIFRDTIDHVPYEKKRDLVKSVVNKVVWDGKELIIDVLKTQ
ncbi:Resolvase, N-terminal domain [Alkaliphilus metalliredigens QYMF]|uniref:Resolvase, N-terminal domain n=1 Tax=Alkaliphilus metalliredigens (strain QYMF) TaxID=293826 RepID=A6TQR3_ALKMQ|nr:recombinase family protein [Alkaliphilus metalliredigens]ABR48531.1 Resolvase, N-terminal domain [Alkaliphilus metalliredigens QYMF]